MKKKLLAFLLSAAIFASFTIIAFAEYQWTQVYYDTTTANGKLECKWNGGREYDYAWSRIDEKTSTNLCVKVQLWGDDTYKWDAGQYWGEANLAERSVWDWDGKYSITKDKTNYGSSEICSRYLSDW